MDHMRVNYLCTMPVIVHLRGIGFNRGIHNYGEMYSRKLIYSIMTLIGLGMQESVAVIVL